MNDVIAQRHVDKLQEYMMNQDNPLLRVIVHPEDVKDYEEVLGPGIEVIGMGTIYEPE